MKRIQDQAEVIVRLDYQSQQAHVCVSAWPAMAAKMERLYRPGLDHDTEDCARRWIVPIKVISFRRPDSRKKAKATPTVPGIAVAAQPKAA